MASGWGVVEEFSPDGRLIVRWSYDCGLGNVEYRKPAVCEVAGGETLLDLSERAFDCQIDWRADGTFILHAARQSGHSARLLVDPEGRSYEALTPGETRMQPAGPRRPLAELSDWLANRLDR